MEGREKLCRIFYIDRMFYNYCQSKDPREENIKQELEKFQKESEELPINEIKAKIREIIPESLSWYNRLENRTFTKKSVKVEQLKIEEWHDDLDGLCDVDGKRLVDFLREYKDNSRVLKRIEFILRNFEIINQFLPIIVRQKDDGFFDVLFGNHRTMAYIEKNYSEIEVLVIRDE